MPGTIYVLVKNKKTDDDPRTISYKSYLDTHYLFDLLGQCDEHGTLIPGDPNLNPQHRRLVNAAVHAADVVEERAQEIVIQKKATVGKEDEPKVQVINETSTTKRTSKPKTVKA